MRKSARVCCIGECMIEMSHIDLAHATARLGFAGDTLNTAVYLSRLGVDTSYVTLLGRDAFSDQMLRMMIDEGIDVSCVERHPTRLPGVYSITVDTAGERSFHYWRDRSAARRLFSDNSVSLDALSGFDVIYLSGITLAILPESVRRELIRRLQGLGRSGKTIVFDSNYRPRLWRGARAASDAFSEMWRCTSIGLPSFDDEARLHPGETPDAAVGRLWASGVREVVLKNGAAGVLAQSAAGRVHPHLESVTAVVDSTGAGDSFNAGYIAARLAGADIEAAVQAAHRLATCVIGHHGAIIPRAVMPLPEGA